MTTDAVIVISITVNEQTLSQCYLKRQHCMHACKEPTCKGEGERERGSREVERDRLFGILETEKVPLHTIQGVNDLPG